MSQLWKSFCCKTCLFGFYRCTRRMVGGCRRCRRTIRRVGSIWTWMLWMIFVWIITLPSNTTRLDTIDYRFPLFFHFYLHQDFLRHLLQRHLFSHPLRAKDREPALLPPRACHVFHAVLSIFNQYLHHRYRLRHLFFRRAARQIAYARV